jgi:hypothetical protein
MNQPRIVLFVEGEGEAEAAPRLVKRILTEQNAWAAVSLDENPFRVGHIHKLVKDGYHQWKRKVAVAAKRPNIGGILLLLDGDDDRVRGVAFCAATIAKSLARESRASQGGTAFSVAVVFARQEYESWLIAGIESLAGKRLADGRLISPTATAPDSDLESSPRNAKGWLSDTIEGGYKPTRDQAALSKLVDLASIRKRGLRSFRRLEAALAELVSAIRIDKHIVSPN